jgi:hypothetical protein
MACNTVRVRSLQRWCVTILLILSLISIASVVAEESEEEEEEEQLYLYEEDAGTVLEYILPEKSASVDPEKPDFLYAPNQGYRIVEFYAPWWYVSFKWMVHRHGYIMLSRID